MLYKYLKWKMVEGLNFERLDGLWIGSCVTPFLVCMCRLCKKKFLWEVLGGGGH